MTAHHASWPRRRLTGFTIIELLVALSILSILTLAAVPVVEMTVRRAKERELKAALLEIRTAIDAYKAAYDAKRIVQSADASGYPPSLELLVDGTTDALHPGHPPLRFLRRIPKDPFSKEGSGSAVKPLWALRSYASPPDMPAPGADVFDIRSLSDGVGLNGMPYREW